MDYTNLVLVIFGLSTTFVYRNVDAQLPSEGIRGGSEAGYPNVFGYQVELTSSNTHCGGGIIDEQYIITAAHCVLKDGEFRNTPIRVTAGGVGNLKFSRGVEATVVKAYVLDIYQRLNQEGDIAILKLKTRLSFGERSGLKRLNLPSAGANYDGSVARITGYGFTHVNTRNNYITGNTEEYGGYTEDKLKYAFVNIISNPLCQQRVGPLHHVYSSHICGHVMKNNQYEQRAGVCSGDSGSPLVVNNTVIGVVSLSPTGCDETVQPARYTRVSSFLRFIRIVLAGETHPAIRSYNVPQERSDELLQLLPNRPIVPQIPSYKPLHDPFFDSIDAQIKNMFKAQRPNWVSSLPNSNFGRRK